nr:MAG TPA: hypothetical protein [Caudoviricetes sp.]
MFPPFEIIVSHAIKKINIEICVFDNKVKNSC